MEKLFEISGNIFNYLSTLKIEQITLISILVTLIIFLWGKHSEVKFKKQELRRVEYKKFINILQKIYTQKFKVDDKNKNEFFDTGVSLLIYGSKKVYKKYVFFREYASNPIIAKSEYNNETTLVYIIADILKAIRHEVGMSSFQGLESNEVLSFFINDIGMNPLSKIQSFQAKRNIKMLRLELFMVDRHSFVFLKRMYYLLFAPIIGGAKMIFKYFVVIPIGRLFIKLFPKFAVKIREDNKMQ